MPTENGFVHFLQQADTVAYIVLGILLLMSLASWYLIVFKSLARWWTGWRVRRFQRAFWRAADMHEVADAIEQKGAPDPFSRLTRHGLDAVAQYQDRRGASLIESGGADEFLTRALRRSIAQDTARLEYGQTTLASVASSAPFVGLFGTVWGIYHALLAIGASGQATLDAVAGPVGEALIMTALGLAVAIPAVLAYNIFSRANRLLLAELDGFAHDLFAFMSTGNRNPAPSGGAK